MILLGFYLSGILNGKFCKDLGNFTYFLESFQRVQALEFGESDGLFTFFPGVISRMLTRCPFQFFSHCFLVGMLERSKLVPLLRRRALRRRRRVDSTEFR